MRTVISPPQAESGNAAAAPVAPKVRLGAKRVGMVMFSSYPSDPRPRRALEALLHEGAVVDLICLLEDGQPPREANERLRICRIPIRPTRGGLLSYAYQYSAFILISACMLAWQSMMKRYDLIYVHNMPDILVLSAMIPKALGARVILDQHDPMPELMMTIFGREQSNLSVRVLTWLEKWSLARANLVVTVNRACKRLFAGRGFPEDKIVVVMNAPDSTIFPFRAARSYSPRRAGDQKTFSIMYHGSLVERNGLDLAVDALAQVRPDIPAAELFVFGKRTPYLDQVMQEVKDRGMEKSVHYMGPRSLEELVLSIEACDVGVIPNHRNAFTEINTPTRIFEYLALGKPVIAPGTPGVQAYFGEDSLFFFESGDAQSLAAKMFEVYSRPEIALQKAEGGQRVYQAHRWENEREMLIKSVVQLLNGLPA
jgi:glycosyltransferase involved in cell wall biosynthesis